MKFGGVIFDCDGVLVDSEPLANAVESEYFSRLGLVLAPEDARRLFKGKTVAEVAALVESTATRALPRNWLYEWAMQTALAFAKDLREISGVSAVLERLERSAARMCVASQSTPARVALALWLTRLDRFFDGRVYTASMVARGKPAPDLFLHAAAQMNVAPADCVVIEDSASGVRAARAAGMTVLGYARDEDAAELAAAGALVFGSMHELPARLGYD